ncbi:DNA adenine methylase [Gorillibacterium sp. sgz5001074]|uniref:DNA adenine methylase n=1 Tax=Gorillibacterium sp. sgz5001074 TaxID=3446695 RepID=UPI003F67AF85
MSKSPLIWFGGKGKVAKQIIRHMPEHKIYIEPFGGAAHVISQKPRVSHEVYNDIDGLVVNFLLKVRELPEWMQQACESLPYSRELYERWKREAMPIDEFQRAVRFFYLNRGGISAGNAKINSTGWRHSTSSNNNPATGYISACSIFTEFAERMKGVMIENTDFREIIEKYDAPDALFYVDPPYIGREKYYAGGFTERDHRDLAAMLNKIEGKAIVSYYQDPMLDELYSGWNRETFQNPRQVVNGGVFNQAEELLLMNYDNRQMSLF